MVAEQVNQASQNKNKRDLLDCYDFEPDAIPQQVCNLKYELYNFRQEVT